METSQPTQPTDKTKTSLLAQAALITPTVLWLIGCPLCFVMPLYIDELEWLSLSDWDYGLAGLLMLLLIVPSAIFLSIIARRRIRKSQGKLRGIQMAKNAITLAIILWVITYFYGMTVIRIYH